MPPKTKPRSFTAKKPPIPRYVPQTPGPGVVATTSGAAGGASPSSQVRIPTGYDWRNMLASDPEYTGGLTGLSTRLGGAEAGRRASIRTALVQHGIKPGETLEQWKARIGGDALGDIDETTFKAAQDNPHAIWRRLQEAYKDNLTQSRNVFEDRGFADSGFRVAGDEFQGLQYNRADTDAVNNLTNLIAGAIGDYTQALGEHQAGVSELTGRVSGRLQEDATLHATADANLVEDSVATYGEPVYRSADGRLWKADGTPFSGAPLAPPPPVLPPPSPPAAAWRIANPTPTVGGSFSRVM